jgi:hypothetical protein
MADDAYYWNKSKAYIRLFEKEVCILKENPIYFKKRIWNAKQAAMIHFHDKGKKCFTDGHEKRFRIENQDCSS